MNMDKEEGEEAMGLSITWFCNGKEIVTKMLVMEE